MHFMTGAAGQVALPVGRVIGMQLATRCETAGMADHGQILVAGCAQLFLAGDEQVRLFRLYRVCLTGDKLRRACWSGEKGAAGRP